MTVGVCPLREQVIAVLSASTHVQNCCRDVLQPQLFPAEAAATQASGLLEKQLADNTTPADESGCEPGCSAQIPAQERAQPQGDEGRKKGRRQRTVVDMHNAAVEEPEPENAYERQVSLLARSGHG